MITFLRIAGGLLAMALGVFFVIKSEAMLQNFGRIEWAEEHMAGSGGSRLMYKLIGIGIIIIGLLATTGLLGGVILGSVGRLFPSPGENVLSQ